VKRFVGRGVIPASTTPFTPRGEVDYPALGRHLTRLVDAGCDGVVVLGSLGEGASLTAAEKERVVSTAVRAVGRLVPVVAAVASARTAEAEALARSFADQGVSGLMILPPYVYRGDDRENEDHVAAAIRATPLPCLLYNNPVAYGVDFAPSQVARLARAHANLVAVKESSGEVARIRALRRQLPADRVVAIGIDDAVLPAAGAGAEGWVAGLANALPEESVALWRLCRNGPRAEAGRLNRWFLPLLRLDAQPKFVQMIKEVERAVGVGNGRVRPPRQELVGAERRAVLELVRVAMAGRRAALPRGTTS
jgi:dihydrodipicolinate synthase/N-acetylneuraminate lyase